MIHQYPYPLVGKRDLPCVERADTDNFIGCEIVVFALGLWFLGRGAADLCAGACDGIDDVLSGVVGGFLHRPERFGWIPRFVWIEVIHPKEEFIFFALLVHHSV